MKTKRVTYIVIDEDHITHKIAEHDFAEWLQRAVNDGKPVGKYEIYKGQYVVVPDIIKVDLGE